MIEEPKPEDPNTEDPRPQRLERQMDVQPEKGEPKLSRDIQVKIGQQLRAMYTDVVDQGVPERFVELLRKLEEGEPKGDE
jgi:hypothetical protein